MKGIATMGAHSIPQTEHHTEISHAAHVAGADAISRTIGSKGHAAELATLAETLGEKKTFGELIAAVDAHRRPAKLTPVALAHKEAAVGYEAAAWAEHTKDLSRADHAKSQPANTGARHRF
jgi:hypothetical protein